MELTRAELTVPGLLVERPRHGYDLGQVIERRGIRQWTDIGFSSIYYVLTKLERRGLVQVPEAPSAAKSRRVFQATPAGCEAARLNALALIEEPRPVAHPLLIGVANLPLLSEHEYAQALRTRLAQVEDRSTAVRESQQGQAPLPPPAREGFSYSLSLLEAERSWLAGRVQVVPDDGRPWSRTVEGGCGLRWRWPLPIRLPSPTAGSSATPVRSHRRPWQVTTSSPASSASERPACWRPLRSHERIPAVALLPAVTRRRLPSDPRGRGDRVEHAGSAGAAMAGSGAQGTRRSHAGADTDEPRDGRGRPLGVADRLVREIDDGRLDLPLPGSGNTWRRWAALRDLGRRDLALARLAEGHCDAVAVLAELGGPVPEPGSVWGVWAAHPPGPDVHAQPDAGAAGWRLSGVKRFCSGARVCHPRVDQRAGGGRGPAPGPQVHCSRAGTWSRCTGGIRHPTTPAPATKRTARSPSTAGSRTPPRTSRRTF
ncbi:hypothetical protein GCM10023224_45400 [Streptomonospora halophila]|uniref:Transcription regulator PadR N-terminal domain-containing protein n=1 Tax=Streptomonospora halophila TaxID=427369 RepID=A0ABP9GVT3_9ACTN